MKSNNLFAKSIAAAVLAANAFLPFAAAAEEPMPNSVAQVTTLDTRFCSIISSSVDGVRGRLAERQSELSSFRTERDSEMKSRRSEWADHRADLRKEHDDNRTERYAKITVHAETDVEKAAVVTFQASVDAAVKARRASVDAAHATFKTGIDKAIADRKVKLDAAMAAFKTAMTAALDKAKADCAVGMDGATVRASYKLSVDAAIAKLQADRKAFDKIGETVKALVDARRAVVEKAHADFKAAVEQARTTLKAALALDASAKVKAE